MKILSLALLIGGLLGLVNVAVLVIAGPSIDSALLLLASMISLLNWWLAQLERPTFPQSRSRLSYDFWIVWLLLLVAQLIMTSVAL